MTLMMKLLIAFQLLSRVQLRQGLERPIVTLPSSPVITKETLTTVAKEIAAVEELGGTLWYLDCQKTKMVN